MNSFRLLGCYLLLLVLGVSCQQAAEPPAAKEYEVVGKVTSVAADQQAVTLDHKDIPGLMKAMEMEFKVASSELLSGIKEGDQVHGKLQSNSGQYVITSLTKD